MVLYRIDDRLVHGQVIVGWIKSLKLKWLYLIDNEIDDSQKMVMKLTVPPDLDFRILKVCECKEMLCDKVPDCDGMVLVKSPTEILEMINTGLEIDKVHIGGLHFRPERDQYCEYVFLSRAEVELIREIIKHDTVVTVQALPNRREIPIEKLIQK